MQFPVARNCEVNAWDNADFVDAVHATARKTLIIAGAWTSVCVMFPALDAKAAGFNVYALIDASGDPSDMESRTTLARFVQAGVIPASTRAMQCEAHRTWARPEAAELAKLYMLTAPTDEAVMESYIRALDVGKNASALIAAAGSAAGAANRAFAAFFRTDILPRGGQSCRYRSLQLFSFIEHNG